MSGIDIFEQIENYSDNRLLNIWNAMHNQMWNSKTMYNDSITMDEYTQSIYNELGYRKLPIK